MSEQLSKSARDALSELYHVQESEGFEELSKEEQVLINDTIELLKKLKERK